MDMIRIEADFDAWPVSLRRRIVCFKSPPLTELLRTHPCGRHYLSRLRERRPFHDAITRASSATLPDTACEHFLRHIEVYSIY